MKIQDYEKELKALNEHLTIKESPQAPDMAGVYYDDIFITGIPNKDIYDEERTDYVSLHGVKHKTRLVANAQIKMWLDNMDDNVELEKEFQIAMSKK